MHRSNRVSFSALLAGAAFAALLGWALPARAAETVHLFLKLDGVDILGESTQISMGRENSIECVLFRTGFRAPGATLPIEGGTITIRKRIDKSSPLLLRGLVTRQVAIGVFK